MRTIAKTESASRFALNFTAGSDPPREAYLELARQAGFRSAMFCFYEYGDGLEFGIDRAAADAARHGLAVVNVHLPYGRMREAWLDVPERGELLEKLFAYLDRAGKAGIPSVTVHPTSGPGNTYVSELGADAFERICERASHYGMDVCVENLRTPIHQDYLFARVKAPNLKFCHDTGHNRVYNPEIDFPSRYARRLAFTHIHDNDGRDDLHLIPGLGKIDFAQVRAGYERAGYRGYLCLELNLGGRNVGELGGLPKFLAAAYRSLEERFGDGAGAPAGEKT